MEQIDRRDACKEADDTCQNDETPVVLARETTENSKHWLLACCSRPTLVFRTRLTRIHRYDVKTARAPRISLKKYCARLAHCMIELEASRRRKFRQKISDR